MPLCEESTGFPCIDEGSLEIPEGEAFIIGAMEPGSTVIYTDPDGETWQHEFTDPHQLVAIGDSQGNTAILIISDRLSYSELGIKG